MAREAHLGGQHRRRPLGAGLGAHPGDYESSATTTAVSPVLDTSALTGVELQNHSWLNILTGTLCYLQVWDGSSWNDLFQCPSSGGVTESSWSYHAFDVTPYAAGNDEFQVRFRWRNNSIAIWDNRITQHYAVCDYLPHRRHMQRVTISLDRRE